MGKATNPSRINPRSKGGRPRQAGERTKGGRLKHSPNARVMEMRAAFGVDHIGQAFSPIQIAYRNGWLAQADCRTAAEFASLHAVAGLGRSSISLSADMEVDRGTETSGDVSAKSFFAQLPDREMAQIWDAVFDDDGGSEVNREERAAAAMKRWKLACAAMTPEQVREVHDVCILDSFPQWVIQRAAGRMDTTWETKRDLLIAGLRAVRIALKPTPQAARGPASSPTHATGHTQIERTIYVDGEGAVLLEVERRSSRSGAQLQPQPQEQCSIAPRLRAP